METLQKTSNGNQVKTEKIDIIKNEKLSIKSFLLLKAEKNTGNKARDGLANERTYLSWMRSCLALSALALAIMKFNLTQKPRTVGYLVFGMSLALLIYSCYRYLQVEYYLQKDLFPKNRLAMLIVSVILFILIVTLLSLVVTGT
jgi:uncharacterized membrane protein YidH (DUF202 family)